jgi:hypothetical protein
VRFFWSSRSLLTWARKLSRIRRRKLSEHKLTRTEDEEDDRAEGR